MIPFKPKPEMFTEKWKRRWTWWPSPIDPALRRQRQEDQNQVGGLRDKNFTCYFISASLEKKRDSKLYTDIYILIRSEILASRIKQFRLSNLGEGGVQHWRGEGRKITSSRQAWVTCQDPISRKTTKQKKNKKNSAIVEEIIHLTSGVYSKHKRLTQFMQCHLVYFMIKINSVCPC